MFVGRNAAARGCVSSTRRSTTLEIGSAGLTLRALYVRFTYQTKEQAVSAQQPLSCTIGKHLVKEFQRPMPRIANLTALTLFSLAALLAAPSVSLAQTAPTNAQSAAGIPTPRPNTPTSANPVHNLPSNYVIHGGDQLNVQVYGDTTLTQNLTVLPDGTVDYPLVGRINVAGKTPAGAARLISKKLERYVRHPLVTVAVATEGQPNVLVLGNVKTPGKYALRSGGRVSDAIAAAGGLGTVNGLFPDARVSDSVGDVSNVSLQRLLHDGDLTLDKTLGEGSVVYVPGPLTYNIEVVGAVDKPGEIQLNQGDRLSMAIAKAGNTPASNSDLNRIRIVRPSPDGSSKTYEVNLYRALENGESAYDIVLQKGDVVYVPEGKKHNATQTISPILFILRRLIGF